MKFEPPLDKPALLQTLSRAYGYPVQNLAFVPQGWVGQHYLAGCADGNKYFLTLLDGSRLARLCLANLDFTLPLTRSLYERGLFKALARPLPTLTGDLQTGFQDRMLVLYEYVQGCTLADSYPYQPAMLIRLGRLVAQLHTSTPKVRMEIPCKEEFTHPFEGELLAGLSALKKVPARHPGVQQILRDLLVPRQETILTMLSCLHDLAELGRLLHPPLVLCHTDITPSNIIHTPQDELVVVDWEGAMAAPAEADLCLFTGDGFPIFLAEYYREAGKPHLHADLFAFYMLRRNLADLTDWIFTILYENAFEEQDQTDLTGVLKEGLQECLPAWSDFESAVNLVRDQLKATAVI